MALKVNGAARIPRPESLYGTVVNILTAAGTVVLDGEDITFDEEMAPVFSTAGFAISSSEDLGPTRKLLGRPGISGRFNRVVEIPEVPQIELSLAVDAFKIWIIEAQDKFEGADDGAYAASWSDYKKTFEKQYSSQSEERKSFSAWRSNLKSIVDYNFDDGLDFWERPNQFSDLSYFDFSTTVLMTEEMPMPAPLQEDPEEAASRRARSLLQTVDQAVDWKGAAMVTSVKDQGLSSPSDIDLSDQQLCSCVSKNNNRNYVSDGCRGGSAFDAINYMYKRNITTEAIMPYQSGSSGRVGSCDTQKLRNTRAGQVVQLYKDVAYVYPWNSQRDLKLAVMKQPIVVYFMADSAFMQYGTTWGEKGYAKVAITQDGDGPCGMYKFSVYPDMSFVQTLDTPAPQPQKSPPPRVTHSPDASPPLRPRSPQLPASTARSPSSPRPPSPPVPPKPQTFTFRPFSPIRWGRRLTNTEDEDFGTSAEQEIPGEAVDNSDEHPED
eukprot:gene22132-29194_t